MRVRRTASPLPVVITAMALIASLIDEETLPLADVLPFLFLLAVVGSHGHRAFRARTARRGLLSVFST